MAVTLKEELKKNVHELLAIDQQERLDQRIEKFTKMGVVKKNNYKNSLV